MIFQVLQKNWITYRDLNPFGSDNGRWFCFICYFMRTESVFLYWSIPDIKNETAQNREVKVWKVVIRTLLSDIGTAIFRIIIRKIQLDVQYCVLISALAVRWIIHVMTNLWKYIIIKAMKSNCRKNLFCSG